MKCLAVIDTNVMVSALLSPYDDAATVQILKMVLNGKIIPVYSSEIIKEYHNVLTRKKFCFDHAAVEYIISAIVKFGLSVDPIATGTVLPDIKDLPFYEAAMTKRDAGAYLVSGNLKHFPKAPFIVSPREFLELPNE